MINLIKSINDKLCQSLFPVILVILILGFVPAFMIYVKNLPDVPESTAKCSITTVTLEGGTKANLKNCNGKITVEESVK